MQLIGRVEEGPGIEGAPQELLDRVTKYLVQERGKLRADAASSAAGDLKFSSHIGTSGARSLQYILALSNPSLTACYRPMHQCLQCFFQGQRQMQTVQTGSASQPLKVGQCGTSPATTSSRKACLLWMLCLVMGLRSLVGQQSSCLCPRFAADAPGQEAPAVDVAL